jgi:predicted metal-dependent RNase
MDINPIASQTSWSLKISGMRPVSSEEYARIKKVMGRDVKHRIETTEKIYLE